MTTLFADRVFMALNGFEVAHLKTANLKIAEGLSRVDTMTRNRKSAGYKYANRSIQISGTYEVEAQKAQIDPAIADPTSELNIVFMCGGERYVATGVRQSDLSIDGSVGDASKAFNFEALDVVNENGVSVNVNISL